MTLDWFLSRPVLTAWLLLVVLGGATYANYWLSIRLGWPFDLRWAMAGFAVGVVPAFLAVAVWGVMAAVIATLALAVLVGVMLYIGEEEPETLDVSVHLRGESWD